ncbi:MAG: 2-C-methyl-D-erythritol 4-phosphate cytidylyltransferase [Bacteroidota bacterium]
MKCSVIVPAGGSGERFGGDLPKQFVELGGIPIIIRTIQSFEKIDAIETVVISVHSDWYSHMKKLLEKYNISKVKELTFGGETRQMSVLNALSTKPVKDSEIVLVHDAVRPFAGEELLNRIIETTKEYGAAVPILKPKDTIKEISSRGSIVRTYDRNKTVAVQTPQGFWTDILQSAYNSAKQSGYTGTDDASLVEFIGYKIQAVEGDPANIKITDPLDLRLAELIIGNAIAE